MAADPAAATAGATTLEAARAHSEKDESRREMSAMNTALADDAAAVSPPVVEGPESMVEAAAVTPPAVQTQTTAAMAAAAPSASSSDRSRLFIVCGRGRKADELHQLFSACGEIRNLHFALDRSSKSRGFAFLQYKDPTCAAAAIEKFHLMKLEDGHVLKVTVAKDKPMVAVGKLKRNQQSSLEVCSESESNGEDSHVPGKRQRSSPPLSGGSFPSAPRQKMRVGDTMDAFDPSVFAGIEPCFAPPPTLPKPPLVSPAQEVTSVLEDIVATIHSAENAEAMDDLMAGYMLIAEHRRQSLATDVAKPDSMVSANGDTLQDNAASGLELEEMSTEQLTSSINSFSLDPAPPERTAPTQQPTQKAARFPGRAASTGSVHQRVTKASLLRRRRQSTDDSDSSGGGSDASTSRRKRSNISHREASSWFHRAPLVDNHLSHPVPAPSSSSSATPVKSKKQCKRQSSDQSADVSTRSSKQRVTNSRNSRTAALHPTVLPSASVREHAAIESEAPRTRLFFISSHKFTMQELEAMFAVYGDFESVEIVKSFGRIKTMAYVKYSSPSTASTVIESFQEENGQGADHPSQGDFMMLSFAETPRSGISCSFPYSRQMDQGVFSPMLQPSSAAALVVPPVEVMEEKLWLLILYDRSLPSQVISDCASKCDGMEFIDIKVFRSTGESQGVAFVKFESEAQAFGASRELHQTELPTGSGRFLQAIVIQDPSLFSTIHGASHAMLPGEHGGNVSRGGGSDDVDLSAVEAKFAHLMRSNDHSSAFTAAPGQHRLSIDEPSPAGTTALQYPALTYYPGPAGSYSAAPLYPMQMQVQPHQAPQVYGYYPQHQPQYHQHLVSNQLGQQQYAYVPALWPTETSSPASYYQSMHPLSGYASAAPMAFPSPPEYYNQPVYPAQVTYPVPVAVSGEENSVAMMAVDTESPPTTGGSSDSSDGARPTPPAIYISGGRSLDLVTVVKALEDCNGVVAITKDGEDNDAAFVVEFADSTQAADAVKTLDGMMCSGKKLRAATMSPGIGGVKQRAGTSRRKRQRVDPRTRK